MQTHQLDDAIHALHHNLSITTHFASHSRVAQWKRAGPITQRSEDQNLALLDSFLIFLFLSSFGTSVQLMIRQPSAKLLLIRL